MAKLVAELQGRGAAEKRVAGCRHGGPLGAPGAETHG